MPIHNRLWERRIRNNITGTSIATLIQEGKLGLLNEFDMPTYIDRKTGRPFCLDLCLASLDLIGKGQVERGVDIGSDHFPIIARFGVVPRRETTGREKRWTTKHMKWDLFQVRGNKQQICPTDVETCNKETTTAIFKQQRNVFQKPVENGYIEGSAPGGIKNVQKQWPGGREQRMCYLRSQQSQI